MAAAAALFMYELNPGDRLVMSDVCYAAVSEMANDMIPSLNIEVERVNMTDLEQVRQALSKEAKLLYLESPNNPLMRLTDIAAVSEIARQNEIGRASCRKCEVS